MSTDSTNPVQNTVLPQGQVQPSPLPVQPQPVPMQQTQPMVNPAVQPVPMQNPVVQPVQPVQTPPVQQVQPAPVQTQPVVQAAPQPAPDLSKYKMRFKNVTYVQLIELAKSSVLLEPNDIPKFEQKYQAMQIGNPELDKAFNVLFEEEYEYLVEEIAEMQKLLAGELKGDQNTDKLLKVYESRLEVLRQIEEQLPK